MIPKNFIKTKQLGQILTKTPGSGVQSYDFVLHISLKVFNLKGLSPLGFNNMIRCKTLNYNKINSVGKFPLFTIQ